MRVLKTYPALASIALPRSAEILDAHDLGPDMAAALVVSYDDADEETTERRFRLVRASAGTPVPLSSRLIKSFRRSGCGPNATGIYCLFELEGDEIPAAIPPEAHRHYLHLKREGFEYRCPAWYAPDGYGSLAQDDIIALSELTPYGYGAIANA